MTRSRILVGVVIAGIYLAVVMLTVDAHDVRLRPVFDGFAPAAKYQWVAPPDAFAAGNRQPNAARATIPLDANGSRHRGIATDDAQAILALGRGAIPPHRSDDRVVVRITPVDGANFALPDRLRANGNAYRVTMTYEPSGTRVTRLRQPGTITLAIPELGRGLFRFERGGRISSVPSRGVPPNLTAVVADLTRPGTYLSGTDLPLAPGPSVATRDHTLQIAVVVGVAGLVAVMFAWWTARRRRTGMKTSEFDEN